jgi:hypothetical protein
VIWTGNLSRILERWSLLAREGSPLANRVNISVTLVENSLDLVSLGSA